MGEDMKVRGQRKRHCGPNKKQKVWTGVSTWKGGTRETDMVVQTRNRRYEQGWGCEREGPEKETPWSKQETEGMNRGEDVKGKGQRKKHRGPNKKQKVWTWMRMWKGGARERDTVVQTRMRRYEQEWGYEREGPEKETWWSKQETEGMNMSEDVKGRGQRKRYGGPNKKQKVWTGVRTWKGGARERDTMVQTRNRRYEHGWGCEREGPEKETPWSKQETEGMNMGEDVKGRGQRKRHHGPNKKQKVWTWVRTWKGGARERDTVVQTRNRRYEQGCREKERNPFLMKARI